MNIPLVQTIHKALQIAKTHQGVLTVKEEQQLYKLIDILMANQLGGNAGTVLDILEKQLPLLVTKGEPESD